MQNHQRLLIIDFGSQVTQLIARRLRELSIYCEIHPFQNVTEKFLQEFKAEAIILSGGPSSITDENSPRPPNLVFELDIPVLGICYGQQVMMAMLGGHVDKGVGTAEFGRAILHKTDRETPLLEGWFSTNQEQVWMSHGDHVSKIAPGFEVFATSQNAPFAIIANHERKLYAVQFHPEVHLVLISLLHLPTLLHQTNS